MRRRHLVLLLGVGTVLLSPLFGCGRGDGIERVAISGSVTFQDEPVVDGQIRFIAQPGTKAPALIERISDGRYATTSSGGVPVGRYRVMIRSWDPNSPLPKGPDDPPRPQLLPAKYNSQSMLELVVESGQGPLTQDYELTP